MKSVAQHIADAPIEVREPKPAEPKTADPWPFPLDEAALHGLAGEFVRTVEPHSEADIAALLGQLLVAFGSAVGSQPYFMAESDRHGVNLNAVFVGSFPRWSGNSNQKCIGGIVPPNLD